MLLSDFLWGHLNTRIPHSHSNTFSAHFEFPLEAKPALSLQGTVFSSSPPRSSLSQLCPWPPLQTPRPDSRGRGGRSTAKAGTAGCLSCQSPLDSDAMRLHSPFVICSCSAFGFQHLPPSPLPPRSPSLPPPHPSFLCS